MSAFKIILSRFISSSAYSKLLIARIMSQIIFIKYLLPVRPKLVPILKVLRIYLKFGTFDTSNMPISISISKIVCAKYLPTFRPKLIPKLKYPEFIERHSV